MAKHYHIKNISQIYDIPPSTLRYWEKEGLLEPVHNAENNYREYDLLHVFVDIGDTCFLRNIGVSIDEIKKIRSSYNITKLKDALSRCGEELEEKIRLYSQNLKTIREKVTLISEFLSAPDEFVYDPVPFEKAIPLDRGNKEHIRRYINNPNCFTTVGEIGTKLKNNINCIAVEADFPGKAAFINDKNAVYLSAYFHSETNDTNNNNFDNLTEKLKAMGVNSKSYVTQFIISAMEDNVQFDYYKVWFKLE